LFFLVTSVCIKVILSNASLAPLHFFLYKFAAVNKYISIVVISILLAVSLPSVAQVAYSKKAERTARRDERKQNKEYKKKHKRAEHRKDKKAVRKEMKNEDREDKRRNEKMKDDITNPKVPIKHGN